MPRRKKVEQTIEEQIAAIHAEIEELTNQVKEKKKVLKALKAEQAEADKAKLIEAFVNSGKSIEEAVELLKG